MELKYTTKPGASSLVLTDLPISFAAVFDL